MEHNNKNEKCARQSQIVQLATAGTKSSPLIKGTVTLEISDANIPVILSLDLKIICMFQAIT